MSKILIDEAVVKLAIAKEALEKLAKLGNGDRYGNSIGNSIAMEALDKMADNARELGLSYDASVVRIDTSPGRVEKEAGNKHIAAPAQEPVAWMDGPHLVMRSDWRDTANYKGPWVDFGRAIPDSWVPVLYTIPPAPAKPWVGLTHDERKKLADVIRFNNIWYLEDMLRAAEEMLERKNT